MSRQNCAAQVLVRVQVDGGRLATSSIPIGYARFSVETGGFFAVTKLSDAELVQEPDADPEKVLRSEGVHSAHVQQSGTGYDNPGVLQIFFSRDAESVRKTVSKASPPM